MLGICAGMQLLGRFAGGRIEHAAEPEIGELEIDVVEPDGLLRGLGERPRVFQYHFDELTELPAGFRVLASTDRCRVQAIASEERGWWGTQFHPESYRSANPPVRASCARSSSWQPSGAAASARRAERVGGRPRESSTASSKRSMPRSCGKPQAQSAAAAIARTPPMATAGTAPISAATVPDSNAPSSFEPPMKTRSTAFTRPRSSGGVSNGPSVERMNTLIMSAAARPARAASESR